MNINSIIFQSAAIGDYLFLIMIVVASIVQAITQNKKKKVLQEMTQKKDFQTSTLTPEVLETIPEKMKGYDSPIDSIFDSIQKMLVPEFEEEKHTWGDDYPEPKAAKIIDNADKSLNDPEAKLMRDNEERHMELITSKPVTEMKAIRYKSRIREGFNLRKAVVYSEILNRKYT